MKSAKLSARETIMLVLLSVLLIGVVYYMAFLTPLNKELAQIDSDISALQAQKESYQEKLAQMNRMQAELDKLDRSSEVAPYDNLVEVLVELDNYLFENSINYTLTFMEPEATEEGTVRRVVEMEFECRDYESARTMVNDLTSSKWRCLVGDARLAAANDGTNIESGTVSVELTVTFFEISEAAAE